MCATETTTMETKPMGTNSVRKGRLNRLRAAGFTLLAALSLSGTAFAQQMPVTGTVTTAAGAPLGGVTVRVQGTDARAVTDASGNYRVTAPSDAVLIFSRVGQKTVKKT